MLASSVWLRLNRAESLPRLAEHKICYYEVKNDKKYHFKT